MIQAVVLIVSGLALLCVGVLSRMGRLEMNPLVGIRTRATMDSDEAWAEAHRVAAWSFLVAAPVAVLGGVMVLQTLDDTPTMAAWTVTTAVFVLGLVVVGGLQGNAAATKIGRHPERRPSLGGLASSARTRRGRDD